MTISKLALTNNKLVDLLKVAILTAPSKSNEDLEHVNGVYLYTEEGLYTDPNNEDEDAGPEPAVMLCSLSTDSLSVAGHTYVPLDGGELKKGVFIPTNICKIIMGAIKDIDGPDDETDAATKIEVDHVTGDVVLTDYHNEDSGIRLSFKVATWSSFPVGVVSTWIGGSTSPMRGDDGNPVPNGSVFSFESGARKVISKVETALKSNACFQVGHRGSITQISIGDNWRGAIKPSDGTKSLDPSDLAADLNLPSKDDEEEN